NRVRHELTPGNRRFAAEHFSCFNLIWSETMPCAELIILCRMIALAFFSDDMNNNWSFTVFRRLHCPFQVFKIMPVYSTDILYSELLKENAFHNDIFQAVFNTVGNISQS